MGESHNGTAMTKYNKESMMSRRSLGWVWVLVLVCVCAWVLGWVELGMVCGFNENISPKPGFGEICWFGGNLFWFWGNFSPKTKSPRP